MTDEPTGRRIVIGAFVVIVAVSGLLGAALGYTVPARTGLEEVTVLSITFTLTPVSVALYGVVTVGTFLATLFVVVAIVAAFDENAI